VFISEYIEFLRSATVGDVTYLESWERGGEREKNIERRRKFIKVEAISEITSRLHELTYGVS
jgi:hypothetical protein